MKYKNMLLVGKAQSMANRKKSRYFQDEVLIAKCELLESRAGRMVKHSKHQALRIPEFNIQNHNAVARVTRQNPFVQY